MKPAALTLALFLLSGACSSQPHKAAPSANSVSTERIVPPEAPKARLSTNPCNDGIDNDGDGQIDWQMDLGCWSADDPRESASPRAQKEGYTTFELPPGGRRIYVSASSGDDKNNGASPSLAVRTLRHANTLVRDGHSDFMLLRRGDVFRNETLGKFKSGESKTRPLVVASYGDSHLRPKIFLDQHFIDHGGAQRNFVALLGLHFVASAQEAHSPQFKGNSRVGLRLVGGGQGWLIEDCRFEHIELVIQSYAGHHYEEVELRRNVVRHNYQVGTCGQNAKVRPSGLYASHVQGLRIEGNLFDHNGWNEDVPQACATMYNHNLYLNANKLVLRENLIARASSMGVKMRSDRTGDAQDLVFENNLFFDGEIGLSIGGNSHEPARFQNLVIRRNVFSQIGRSNPTQRSFSWGLDLKDTENSLIEENFFLTQPWFDNAYAIAVHGAQSNLLVSNNVFAGLRGIGLKIDSQDTWQAPVRFEGNRFHQNDNMSCLVAESSSQTKVRVKDNLSFSPQSTEFCAAKGQASGGLRQGAFLEPSAQSIPHSDITIRTLKDYASYLGLEHRAESVLDAAAKQSRLNYQPALSAPAINDYIRAGFAGAP